MRRAYYLVWLTFLASTVLFGQDALAQAKISFDKEAHNFGTVKEEDGPAEVTFTFTNTGDQPLTLSHVKASCGCTTPSWTKEAVAPGETGKITASYNPARRPGAFSKTITVRSNAEPSVKILRISGTVTPRPKGPQDWYPREMGNLRFTTTHLSFGTVLHDQVDTASVIAYNQGDQPIEIKANEMALPAHILPKFKNLTIAPKETATLLFSFDAPKKNDWGYIFDASDIVTSDTDKPNKRFVFSADIKENFGEITADTKLPVVKVDKTEHNFGEVAQNARVSTTFKITNEGNAELVIRKTSTTCGCTVSKPAKDRLAPGESTTLDVTYSSGTHSGQQTKGITLITNDPKTSSVRLNIKANVKGEASH